LLKSICFVFFASFAFREYECVICRAAQQLVFSIATQRVCSAPDGRMSKEDEERCTMQKSAATQLMKLNDKKFCSREGQ
jgi:hypothetical protein